MKVAYVCNEYPPRPHGGIGTFVYTMAHALVERGHEVTVVEMGKRPAERRDGGVRVITLPTFRATFGQIATVVRLGWLVDRWRLRNWLARAAQRGEIDLVEVADYQGWLPFSMPFCPVVVRLHLARTVMDWAYGQQASYLHRYLERSTLRKHPRWIAVSDYILQQTQRTFGLVPNSAQTVYYPVPEVAAGEAMAARAGKPDDYVLFVGRLEKRKGVLELARAVRLFLPQFPMLKLVFVGPECDIKGEPARRVLKQVVGDAFAKRLVFTGHVPRQEVYQWMRSAKVFVMPSHFESFGIVLIEAMQCGVPTVSTRRGAGPEIVTHGVNGLLVEPTDAEALAEAIATLLRDPQQAQRLARCAAASVRERFTIERCVAQSVDFYRRALAAAEGDGSAVALRAARRA